MKLVFFDQVSPAAVTYPTSAATGIPLINFTNHFRYIVIVTNAYLFVRYYTKV